MFGWEFPPYQAGGLATATHGLVKGLLDRGIEVTLVVPFAPPPSSVPVSTGSELGPRLRLVSGRDYAGRLKRVAVASPLVPYIDEPAYLERRGWLGGRGPAPSAVYGLDLIDEVDRMAALAAHVAAREPHDIIDVHDWLTFRAGIRAREVSGRPLVAHIHATEFDRAGEGANADIQEREREGLVAADRVISNSDALKRQVMRRYGVPGEKISVIHWGVDTPETEESEPGFAVRENPLPWGDPVVLFLGRVTRQKGPDLFVEVAGRVAEFVPNARFVVAGAGDLLPNVVERGVELGLADRLHFAGALDRREVVRAYRMASVCVMPSVSEPFGLVALESLQQGTPCIVPKAAGVAEALVNVFKVDFWDLEEMTNKIVALLRHRELLEELGRRGREELDLPRFSLAEPARLTEEAYRRALGSPKPDPINQTATHEGRCA